MAKGRTFTERELDIMNILWGEGSGTVAEVRDELPLARLVSGRRLEADEVQRMKALLDAAAYENGSDG